METTSYLGDSDAEAGDGGDFLLGDSDAEASDGDDFLLGDSDVEAGRQIEFLAYVIRWQISARRGHICLYFFLFWAFVPSSFLL